MNIMKLAMNFEDMRTIGTGGGGPMVRLQHSYNRASLAQIVIRDQI